MAADMPVRFEEKLHTTGHPMALPHLLGEAFENLRWYDNEEARARAFEEMNRNLVFYRQGDRPSQQLEKVEE